MTGKDKLKRFYKNNEKLLENNVIKNFLDIKENEKMLEKVLIDPSEKNFRELDESFKEYYLKIRIIKYISNLIYFYTIDFDKRINKRNQRYNLILDGSECNDSNENAMNLIDKQSSSNSTEKDYFENEQSLNELIENQKLYKIYQQLTDKQKEILELIYVRDFTNKEVAEFYNETPQNISNLHKRALKKIKKNYKNH